MTVLVLLLTVGCTGSGSEPEPSRSSSPGSAGDEPLDVAAVWSGVEKESMAAVLAAFTRQTGIRTRLTSTGEDVASYLDGRVEAGDAPDVALVPQVGLMRSLADRRLLTPVSPEARTAVASAQGGFWPRLGTHGGQHYGVVFKVANKSVWWYDPAVLREAGTAVPVTFEQTLAAAADLAATGRALLSVGAADGWPLTDLFENLYLLQAGPVAYDRLARHETSWTDPTVLAALDRLRRLVMTENALVGGPEGVLAQDFPASVDAVFGPSPRGATVFEGDFVASVIAGLAPEDVPVEDYDFFPFPGPADGQPAVVAGADIAVAMTSRPQAQRLLAFLATPEAARPWITRGGFQSPAADLPSDVYPDDLARRLDAQLDAALAAGRVRYDLSDSTPPSFGSTPGQGLYLRLQELVRGAPVQQVAAALEEDATAAYRTF